MEVCQTKQRSTFSEANTPLAAAVKIQSELYSLSFSSCLVALAHNAVGGLKRRVPCSGVSPWCLIASVGSASWSAEGPGTSS